MKKGVSKAAFVLSFVLILPLSLAAQTVAILAPEKTETAVDLLRAFYKNPRTKFQIVDTDLADAVLRAQQPTSPFNMSLPEARQLGSAIGSRYFVLLKADTYRRSSFERKSYFEAFVAIYLVDSLTGRLAGWRLFKSETADDKSARGGLRRQIPSMFEFLEEKANPNDEFGSVKNDSSQLGPGARAPLPYRRIKPEYTHTADFYSVEATVDIEVTIGKTGEVSSTRIVRWAGFGLDESVEKVIRSMNWRAADQDGETFSTTVLLRYNFKDLDRPDQDRQN